MNIHDLARKYGVSDDELVVLLKNHGYDVGDPSSPVDYDMLAALERHFSWDSGGKAKAKSKRKTKAKTTTKAKTKSKAKAKAKAKAKVVSKAKAKSKIISRARPRKEEPETAEKKTKATAKAKAKTKVKAKAKTKTATKTKAKAKATAKTKAATETTAPAAKKTASPAPPKAKATEKPRTKEPAAKKETKAAAGAPGVAAERAATPEKAKPAKTADKPKKRAETGVAVKPAKEETAPKPKPKGRRAEKATGKPAKKAASRQEVQEKAVRESVRRTLAKLETTRKTKRKKTRSEEEIVKDLPPLRVQEHTTVAALSRALDVPVDEVVDRTRELGVEAAAMTELERDVIELVADEFGRMVEIEAMYGEKRLKEVAQIDPEKLESRAPVVTVMGHVDHGKTSILDKIREARVAEGEAGGITQHIGAYEVETPHGKLTFIDTPGHEAFTSMRSRGAQITDIVVLVVAADDGVMPQTIEAINHTRAAGVPMVVAVNKCDLPGANPDNVKQQLMQREVMVESYGGEVVDVSVSAKTGEGLDKLLEMISLQAELLELKADRTARAQGVVVEVKKEEGRGILTTVLVQQGTLRVGDVFVVGNEYGKVRSLIDHRGKTVKEATPSVPVQVLGANGLPVAGDTFICVENEKEAREIAVKRQEVTRDKEMQPAKSMTLEDLYAQIQGGELKELKLIIRADVDGSAEALKDSLSSLKVLDVSVDVIHSGVGVVSESDVMLAASSEAIIIAFNTKASPKAKEMAGRRGVDVRRYSIIYECIEDIENAMKGMLEPEFVERVLGKAEVRKVFRVSKLGSIAGSMVIEGAITRNASARVLRDSEVVYDGRIDSLKRFQDDVKEVAENFECGIGLHNFDALEEQDIIEAYVVEEKSRLV